MGAWSEGGFGNDTAMDFADEVASVSDLDRALKRSEGLYDSDAASQAVAAAEVIAACLGRPSHDFPKELKGKLSNFGTPSDALIKKARVAMSEVSGTSELAELWEEAQDESWKAAMNDLLARLDMATPYVAPPRPEPVEAGPIGAVCCLCGEDIAEAQEVTLTIEDEYSTMTMFAHRACLETSYDPPHFDDKGGPTPELLAQFTKTF